MLRPALTPRPQRPQRRRLLLLGVVALVALLVAQACSSPATEASGTRAGTTTAVTTASGADEDRASVTDRARPRRRGCARRPSACGYPDASNTGPRRGVRLRPSGPINADRDGQVIRRRDVRGEINVTASNVTIKNSRVTGGRGIGPADWVIIIRPGAENLRIIDSVVRTRAGSAQDLACIFNIGDTRPVVRRVDLHGCTIGVSSGAGLVRDSYIHDLAQIRGLSHNVGIASNGGGGLAVRHNTIFNQYEQTAAIAMYQDFGGQRNNVVRRNLLAGGGYCVYGGGGATQTSRIRFIDNRFSRRYSPGCGQYGVAAWFTLSDPGNVWRGNYWDDTLRPARP